MAGQNHSGASATAEHSAPKRKPKSLLTQRISYALGNLGQAAYYNALSTYFCDVLCCTDSVLKLRKR